MNPNFTQILVKKDTIDFKAHSQLSASEYFYKNPEKNQTGKNINEKGKKCVDDIFTEASI